MPDRDAILPAALMEDYPGVTAFAILPLDAFDRMRDALRNAGLADQLEDITFMPVDLDPPPCPHESVGEATTNPVGPSGICEVYAVCEDCGEELGPAGFDFV